MNSKREMTCQMCGSKMPARLLKGGSRFSAHCYGCGLQMFGPGLLLERLEYVDTVCPHTPELKPCKRAFTSWCPICRVRTFAYTQDKSTSS